MERADKRCGGVVTAEGRSGETRRTCGVTEVNGGRCEGGEAVVRPRDSHGSSLSHSTGGVDASRVSGVEVDE